MTSLLRTLKSFPTTSMSVQCRSICQLPRKETICLVSSLFYRSDVSCFRLNCGRDNRLRQAKTTWVVPLPLVMQKSFCSESTGKSESSNKRPDRKLPKIYTRTGDKGTSVTIAGDRRPKNDIVFEALGATDELSSHIGLAREFVQESSLTSTDLQLEEIQCILQDAGSNIATPKSLASQNQLDMTGFNGATVEMLETWIDEMTTSLPPLRNFILPSGGSLAVPSMLQDQYVEGQREGCKGYKVEGFFDRKKNVCHGAAICSSTTHAPATVASLRIAPLATSDEIDPAVARFINRLSDYLFTAARFVAQEEGKKETVYRRVKPKDKK